jgi:catechol 2,3-dioxygenase-like lactoylglutathione lyase family enzyme
MSRIHLALNTDRLEESIAFYRVLFDTEPAKVKPDWAKFDLQEPALNLTLNRVGEAPGGDDISHLGIELQDSAAVAAVDERLRERGLQTRVEEHVTCCYARQDKTWVRDPNGHGWEFFFVKD